MEVETPLASNGDGDQPQTLEAQMEEEIVILPETFKEKEFTRNFSTEVEDELLAPSIQDRMQWSNPREFLMSCISMSVGLGNVWRFPVTAYENGGGAFLIPYLIVLIVIGRPLYFLELVLGQFTSYSQVEAWRIVPLFKGVGYASMIATITVITYYASVMATCLYYFGASFHTVLPWSQCDESWAGKGQCNSTGANMSIAEAYYLRQVIKEASSIENGIGYPDLNLSICLLVSWIVLFFSLINGVKSSGKVAWFTTIFPYVVMAIIFIRGVTLTGAWSGIMYFITPRWDALLKPSVWYQAVTQCFFSLNAGFGSIIMFGSHNPFRHNIYKDATVVSILDTMTSLLAGFTIFAILGNLAVELDTDVATVVKNGGGAGLAFISYADAMSKLTWCPQLFACLFFFMLFTLGLGSSISDVGTVITIFCDKFPKAARWRLYVTLVVCICGFLSGLPYVTPGGQFVLEMVDFFGGTFVIFTSVVFEIVGIAWIYGLYNYLDDIEFMLNIRLGIYWRLCWGIVIPFFMTGVLIYTIFDGVTPKHNDMEYPTVILLMGWMIVVMALMCLPIGAVYALMKIKGGTFQQKLKGAVKSSTRYGPSDPQLRRQWVEFKNSRPQISLLERIKTRQL